MYPRLNNRENIYVIPAMDGGIIIDENESRIDDNNSPDMLNMIFDGNILRKRDGQKILFSEEKSIISCYEGSFYNYIIYHTDDKIKAYHIETSEICTVMTRLSQKAGVFFSYNGYIYYNGSGEFYKISFKDEILSCEVVEGYIPTVLVNCSADGVGDKYEEFNFLTEAFKVTFNTSEGRTYIIPNHPLDREHKITVKFNEIILSEKKYEIDYETGTLTFNDSLETSHNMLEVTAYTKKSGDRSKITNCTLSEVFGGSVSGLFDGTRVFLSGNKEYETTFFYSDLKNPEYFPINQFDILGNTNDPITGIAKQYSSLVFFKEKSIYLSSYVYDENGVNFTVSQANDIYGCDCPETIVSIDNQLTWLNSRYGVLTLASTSIKDEKNVKCISGNINGSISKKALLTQPLIRKSVGFINHGKYYLVTGEYTYVLNMRNNFSIGLNPSKMSWFVFDSIKASCYFYIDKEVYMINEDSVVYFSNVLYDFDKSVPIKAYVKTKALDFRLPGIFKYIEAISLYAGTLNNSYIKMSYRDENGEFKKKYEYHLGKFNFINFSFSDFTFYSNLFSVFLKRKISRRRCNFFSVFFENTEPNSQMAISDILISYYKERGARYNGI